MLVVPAIDLRGGRCVRLVQGRAEQEKAYDADPTQMAMRFAQAGATRLHLVDLDGAFSGRTGNLEAIRKVRAAFPHVLELGGGMRTLADIQGMLDLGIDQVIVGTMAVLYSEILEEAVAKFGGDRLILGIDAKAGKVAISGWVEETPLDAVDFALMWKALGIGRAIFTDIARDGMMQGPNLEAIRAFAQGSGMRVTASGGVSNMADVRALEALEPEGVDQVIVGKAIYEGALRLEEVWAC